MQVAKRYIYSCGKFQGSQYRWTPFGLPVHCFGRFYSLQSVKTYLVYSRKERASKKEYCRVFLKKMKEPRKKEFCRIFFKKMKELRHIAIY
jgi:hypothetical protein